MNKLCLFFDGLALYRRAIYKKINNSFDCEWYIEDINYDVRSFDEKELGNVSRLKTIKIGPFIFVYGLCDLLKKGFDTYLMSGETGNVSLFFFCLLKKIFYPKKRVFLWTHGFYGKEKWIELFFWKKPFFKLADGIFTYGDYSKQIMLRHGFKSEKIYPIHNSLDYDEQLKLRERMVLNPVYFNHFHNDYPVIVFIGRLTKVKKLELLIESITLLKEREVICNLVFVGDGIARKDLEMKVESAKLDNQVWFYGECFDEETNAQMLYNATLCVSPGNIGLTVIHSLMFGCPAISHNNFAMQMPEFEAIEPGTTGDFFEYDDSLSLSKTIENWLRIKKNDREETRKACYNEIDLYWNPNYQMQVLNSAFDR